MFDVVIPVKQSDLFQLETGISYIRENIRGRHIVIITDTFQLPQLSWFKNDGSVRILDENTITNGLTLEQIKEYLRNRFGTTERAGWYFQQFIKMAYCEICEDDSYLLWDADTIPLHPILFTNGEGKKYLALKEEYHPPYFRTIENILGLSKEEKCSYIAEHMIIDTMVMRQLIKEIEDNNKLEGDRFFWRILNSISDEDMFPSGFSEYETFGTYAMKFFSEKYEKRSLKALRVTKRIFGDGINRDLINWVAGTSDYMLLTIETSQKPSCLACVCGNPTIRKWFSARFVINMWNLIVLKIFKRY